MKRFKRILRAALIMLVVLGLMIPTALCAGAETPAENDKCSLTLNFTPESKAAPGVVFSLYRVADVFPEQVKFQALEEYDYHVLEDAQSTWAEKAATLKGYVERDQKTPEFTAETDAEGKVSFTGLDKGIYLVLGTQSGDLNGYMYTPAPFLLTLPAFDEAANGWVNRNLEANVKSYNSTSVTYPPISSPKYLEVIVQWEDNDNEAGERPDSVVVELYHRTTGKVIHTVTVEEGKEWEYKWRDPWGDLEARIKDASRDDLISRNYNEDTFDKYNMTEQGNTRTYVLTLAIGEIEVPDPETPLDPGDPSDPSDPSGGNGGLRVLKVWEDNDNAAGVRPESVTVDLLGNGKVYDTVELSAGNNWRHTWTGLDESAQWQVVEREQVNYTVSVSTSVASTSGVTQVITNTYSTDITDEEPPLIDMEDPDVPLDPGFPGGDPNPEDPLYPGDPNVPMDPGVPGDPDNPAGTPVPGEDIPDGEVPLEMLPQTGLLWWPVPIMAVLGVALVLLGYIRRRNSVS